MKIIRKRGSCLIIKTIGILVINSFYHYKKRQKKRESRLFIYQESSCLRSSQQNFYEQESKRLCSVDRTSIYKKVSDYVQTNRLAISKKGCVYLVGVRLFYKRGRRKRTAIPHVVRSYHWYNAGIAVLGLNNIYR